MKYRGREKNENEDKRWRGRKECLFKMEGFWEGEESAGMRYVWYFMPTNSLTHRAIQYSD